MARGGYEKLSGRSTLSTQQAYLGDDHLLIVDGVYQERLKHIRYEDIQAILICPTNAGTIFSLLAGLGGLLLVVVTLANLQSNTLFIWLFVTLVFWSMFAMGLYHRGTAVFGAQTAVQTLILTGLGTRRKAEKGLARLSERVEAAQGKLSKEALQAALSAQSPSASAQHSYPRPTVGPPTTARPPAPPPIRKLRPAAAEQNRNEGP